MDSTNNKLYAMYSARQAEIAGIVIYLNKDGNEVRATEVSSDPNFTSNLCEDKVFLGEVERFVRAIKPFNPIFIENIY